MSSDALSSSDVDIVAAHVKTAGASFVTPVVGNNAIFYAPFGKGFFSLLAANSEEVGSLINSMIPRKFKFKKDYSCHFFGDDTAPSRILSVVYYVSAVDEGGIPQVKEIISKAASSKAEIDFLKDKGQTLYHEAVPLSPLASSIWADWLTLLERIHVDPSMVQRDIKPIREATKADNCPPLDPVKNSSPPNDMTEESDLGKAQSSSAESF
ncbi:hypothetical protein HAX54_005643 [Datura stramonium]|uniref:Uncharacterized protein n=1 Tax=Datura stramonium TaxID=4076 RepID=A0ABS8T954_DATST|nr:hypothetical protein [Datura stramonium]